MTTTEVRTSVAGTPRPFGTLMTAMVTPFTHDGAAIDLASARRLAAWLLDRGCDGILVNGTTGETPTTLDSEKKELVAAVVDEVGDRALVMAGVGSNDTAHSLRMLDDAVDAGAHAILSVTPYYNKPSQEGIIAHTRALADGSDLPFCLYDIPGRVVTPLAETTIRALAEHPRIVAVKDAKGDLLQSSLVLGGTGLSYYCGEDAFNLPWLSIGASGLVSVTAHVAAPLYRAMIDAVDSGDTRRAAELHLRAAPVVEAVMTRMQGAVASKIVLADAGIIDHATVRLPLAGPGAEEERRLVADVRAATGPDGAPLL